MVISNMTSFLYLRPFSDTSRYQGLLDTYQDSCDSEQGIGQRHMGSSKQSERIYEERTLQRKEAGQSREEEPGNPGAQSTKEPRLSVTRCLLPGPFAHGFSQAYSITCWSWWWGGGLFPAFLFANGLCSYAKPVTLV